MTTNPYERFADAVHQLTGRQAPGDMIHEWVDNITFNGVHRLQHWVCSNLPQRLDWAQGIVLLDAAAILAMTPEEGANHAHRVACERADAARYRWLRAGQRHRQGLATSGYRAISSGLLRLLMEFHFWCKPEELDRQIDQQIQKETSACASS